MFGWHCKWVHATNPRLLDCPHPMFFWRIPVPAIAKTHNQRTASSYQDNVRSERVKSISLSWPDSYTDRQTMANSCISWPFGRYLQGQICAEKALISRSCTQVGMFLLLGIWKKDEKSNSSRHLKAQFLQLPRWVLLPIVGWALDVWVYRLFWLCGNTARCNKQSLALFGSNLPNEEGKSSNFGDPLLSLRMTPCQEDLF